jgi:hypothetical protein
LISGLLRLDGLALRASPSDAVEESEGREAQPINAVRADAPLSCRTPQLRPLPKYEPTAAVALDNPGLLGGFYARKGHCEWHFGRLDEALETAKQAIDLTEACGNASDAGSTVCGSSV